MRPRRAPRVLLLSLTAALTIAVGAATVRAQEAARAAVIVPVPAAPVAPLSGAQGAGWTPAPSLERAPLLVAPPPAPRVPLARRWWFWASLGAAAVAVVIAGLTVKPGEPYSGNANPGVVPLP